MERDLAGPESGPMVSWVSHTMASCGPVVSGMLILPSSMLLSISVNGHLEGPQKPSSSRVEEVRPSEAVHGPWGNF